jgi:hypothetical protein
VSIILRINGGKDQLLWNIMLGQPTHEIIVGILLAWLLARLSKLDSIIQPSNHCHCKLKASVGSSMESKLFGVKMRDEFHHSHTPLVALAYELLMAYHGIGRTSS